MPWEGPGQYLLRSSEKFDVNLHIIELWHKPIPDITLYDGLIVLGGGLNVDQEDRYDFLVEEKVAVHKAIEQDMPYLGFCLGHQLLADALGAKVGPNFQHSVGFVEGLLTKNGIDHPLFYGIPRSLPLFKWHSLAVQQPLPKQVEILATSKDCEVEAISVKKRPHIIGLQFDNHSAYHRDVRRWLDKNQSWISSLSQPEINPALVLADARRLEGIIKGQFEIMFRNYIDIIS